MKKLRHILSHKKTAPQARPPMMKPDVLQAIQDDPKLAMQAVRYILQAGTNDIRLVNEEYHEACLLWYDLPPNEHKRAVHMFRLAKDICSLREKDMLDCIAATINTNNNKKENTANA